MKKEPKSERLEIRVTPTFRKRIETLSIEEASNISVLLTRAILLGVRKMERVKKR